MQLISSMKNDYKNEKKIKKKLFNIYWKFWKYSGISERGATVIQICDYPLFDIYTNNIWPSIISKNK